MIKLNRVAGTLAVGTALLLVTGLALPPRVLAQTPSQGQFLGILLLLGLGARQNTKPPANAKKSDEVAKKAAPASGKGVSVASDPFNGHMAIRSVERTVDPRTRR